MKRYSVIVSALNLRSSPTSSDPFNILGRLSFQTVVEVVNSSNNNWWEVRTILAKISGYVAARYLKPILDEPIIVNSLIKADFPNDSKASLHGKNMMYKPIGSPTIQYRDITSPDSKRSSIQDLVDILNVSQNERYKRTEKYTFCNIYAYDFCHFCSAYIPRVWWNSRAITRLQAGEDLELLYGETVYELNANALHDWFLEWGDDFGWTRMTQAEEIQNAVNDNGGVGIVCAKRREKRKSGHITIVVPETDSEKAYRQAGVVLYPLQTQAGANNYNYFSKGPRAWWRSEKFISFAFLFHQ